MTTLNPQIKKQATSNFILLYSSSLITVLLLSYFLFRAPLKIYKDQVKEKLSFEEQRHTLLSKTDSITTQLSNLMALEKANASNPDSGLDRLATPIIQKIDNTIAGLKEDSAMKVYNLMEKDLGNYLFAYNAFLTYHHLSKNMFAVSHQNNITPNEVKPVGIIPQINAEPGTKLQAALALNADYKQQIQTLKDQLRTATQPVTNPTTNNDAADQWEKEKQRFVSTIAGKDNDLVEARRKIRDLENNVGTTTSATLNAAEKATVMYQIVDQLITKGLATSDPSRGICSEAKRIIQDIRKDYPNKSQLDNISSKVRKFCEVQ